MNPSLSHSRFRYFDVKPVAIRSQQADMLRLQKMRTLGSTALLSPETPRRYSRLQLGIFGLACMLFAGGLLLSQQQLHVNHQLTPKVSAQTNSDSSGPSTAKPTNTEINSYSVAPDLARYIKIPKLKVSARVLQTGLTKTGAIDTPLNVYDTAWYTSSAKPGQAGAVLIDGHVSSRSTKGVFYGLNKLAAGDRIQLERGDGAVLSYKVVKTQAYDADRVDMQAATQPITDRPGLNLITCGGKVKPGTNQYNQRIVVFTEQI
jgi:LPXTG-site transpeptidase (sortase) family protein